MRVLTIYILTAVVALGATTACKSKQTATSTTSAAQVSYTGEQTIIYRTRTNYSRYVPVTMNAEKTEIVAYPAPSDVYRAGKLAYPTPLADGYLLDNRGVGVNSVFLKLTYEEYSKLAQVPSLAEMQAMILDKDPFLRIYNLGTRSRFKDEVVEINNIINKNELEQYKRLK
jgi:uncharacterized protein (DUF39 family)